MISGDAVAVHERAKRSSRYQDQGVRERYTGGTSLEKLHCRVWALLIDRVPYVVQQGSANVREEMKNASVRSSQSSFECSLKARLFFVCLYGAYVSLLRG